MCPAALPGRIGQCFRYRVLDAFVSITGDQVDIAKPAGFQILEEAFPRCVGFRSGDVHAEHFPVAIGVDTGGKQH